MGTDLISKGKGVSDCFSYDLCDADYVGYTAWYLHQHIAEHKYSAISWKLTVATTSWKKTNLEF